MRVHRTSLLAMGAAFALSVAGCASREAPAATPAPQAAERPAPSNDNDDFKPYSEVITDDAVTQEGLFLTHEVDGKLYFEIPPSEYDKDMMIMTRVDEGGWGSRGNRNVRWERHDDRVELRTVDHSMVAHPDSAIYRAVHALTRGSIIASFDIETFGADSAAVIEVTRLYTTNIPEFIQVTGLQSDRTRINEVRTFPTNIDVLGTQTGANAPAGTPASTMRINWSMLKLPEEPMMPRLHDSRVGIMSMAHYDFSRPEHRSEQRRFIRKFRLEKENPNAEISDPVEPIVFWIDRATPEWLIPYVEAGVDQWLEAYEEAGFSNAIIPRLAPTPEEDPTWSQHDARNSMIYWRASTVANATGGNTVDPRTGEILKAEVNMYHNVMNLLRNWYFVQVSPLDERARELPLPDSLMGELVEYVVAHEIGHAVGFPHNFKASAMYPADSIRSADFLERMGGHVATLMDYSRFNYVAQPEDSIPVHLLIPKVGPYDRFAVMWQNKPIPGATTPDEEWETLDSWSRMQDTVPWFRFTTPGAPNDPEAVTEAVGNADAVQSSTLAMRNLERVMGSLLDVAERPGQDYSTLEELYGNVVGQWGRYNSHVAAIVGGAYTQEKYGTGARFEPVSRAEQQEALEYLKENAFRVPEMFLDQDVLRRIEAEGVVSRFGTQQGNTLRVLMNPARLNRLVEYEALANGQGVYSVADLMADLRDGVWSEITASNPQVSVYRRNLQRVYLEVMDGYLNPESPQRSSDARPIVRAEMRELATAVGQAANRSNHRMTQLHLQDIQEEINRILDH
ncbi:MAG: DUF5117 domain-containing protein [Gemmatimonadales bacterium]|nr:MAG: DUF5117 domain-containing protein [Gemmatimonadales bacterium]